MSDCILSLLLVRGHVLGADRASMYLIAWGLSHEAHGGSVGALLKRVGLPTRRDKPACSPNGSGRHRGQGRRTGQGNREGCAIFFLQGAVKS